MNQRSFFKSLALIGAAASVSPQIFLPRFEPVHWKVKGLVGLDGRLYPCKIEFIDMPPVWLSKEPPPEWLREYFGFDKVRGDGLLVGHAPGSLRPSSLKSTVPKSVVFDNAQRGHTLPKDRGVVARY